MRLSHYLAVLAGFLLGSILTLLLKKLVPVALVILVVVVVIRAVKSRILNQRKENPA